MLFGGTFFRVTRTGGAVAPHDHAVNFYDHDADVVAEVARYVADGLANGERVIVVATAAHRAELDDVLVQHGTDAVRARVTGGYLPLDAAETLATFMVDGSPDRDRFLTHIGDLIGAAAEGGHAVRVFGEMVALLWADGNVAGAIALESLWNEIAQLRQFSLLCAYSLPVLGDDPDLASVSRVCDLHSSVSAPRSYTSVAATADLIEPVAERSEVFVPVPEAVPAVRRFITQVLESWGEPALVPAATLVASELATNAIRHASSPFRASASWLDAVVRIAIEDVDPGNPELVHADPSEFSGRGVAIVADLSQRWGYDRLPTGKVVWSELARKRV